MQSEIELDPSQQDVAHAAPEERRFVVAAAGQGKTEVLLERIRSLRADGLNPADEVLVLSFSRAAVETARRRSLQQGLDGVLILTFDALAARLLLDGATDANPLAGSFEQRIRRATELVRDGDLPPLLEPVRHILIDEAQDVVGDRAELVLAIFDALGDDLGFTVLGDPLQGIYDFQLDESVSQMTSSEFRRRLFDDYAPELVQLEGHYRATSSQMRSLIDIAGRIRPSDGDVEVVESAHEVLDRFRRSITSSNFLDEAGVLEPDDGDTTAVLTSTNYEVLIASELLWNEGISHVVRRRSQDMRVAPWVHTVLHNLEARSYPEKVILDKLSALGDESVEDRWRDLKTAEGDFRSHSSLNVALLGQRLRHLSVPVSLTVSDHHALTVSTVHRSKGLEFTNVIYLPPGPKAPAGQRTWPTLRQKYVALSRAREQLISSGFPKGATKACKTLGTSNRWSELRFYGGRSNTARMEFLNADIDDQLPFGRSVQEALEVQLRLSEQDVIGTPIHGVLDESSVQDGSAARYFLFDEAGNAVGRTAEGFGWDLRRAFRLGRKWNWPESFLGARITSVECATGNPQETMDASIGASGMWLVPRLTGLIRPIWKKEQ
ncbi:UvrD-helicase domain-containing protein [Arthrobacter mangrovi]|uniref:UvrD-like helicase ATP-binding domain-containing protein n=1 Tax=Arthrobacter mangrovi TaxID=2966350 RepID=A0ABQ5MPR0_9MICC|nr:UvrD-helicase domain-containing protein [Arthrobacter mangrovi]GLB65926.1 hypothetical protein AHIS1636_03650 [Arthrobacter mangrovi]